MTIVPLTQCSHLLAVDAKTLRQWLKHANLSLHSHPTDARIKGLTIEQVQQLATLHTRAIKLDAITSSQLGLQEPTKPASSALPPGSDADLPSQLSSLQAMLSTLQQQVTQLALELLHEREHRLQATAVQQQVGLQEMATIEAEACPDVASAQSRPLHPGELRARSRVIPLVEYGASGSYVIIDPLLGECHFLPDSTEWFDWLATLSSFRFVGLQGRFTASRGGSRRSPKRTWFASRFFHARKHRRYLAVTDRLSIDRLEQVAAELQSHIASL
jgi:hypothetical protein